MDSVVINDWVLWMNKYKSERFLKNDNGKYWDIWIIWVYMILIVYKIKYNFLMYITLHYENESRCTVIYWINYKLNNNK